jgi:hypothetical protein
MPPPLECDSADDSTPVFLVRQFNGLGPDDRSRADAISAPRVNPVNQATLAPDRDE